MAAYNMSNIHVSPDVLSTLLLLQQGNLYKLQQKLCMTSPEAVVRRWSVKKLLLKQRRIHRKIPVSESFFNKLQAFRSATLLKRDSKTDVFLLFCEIFKNTYFEEHLWTICRWKVYLKINQKFFSQIFLQIFLRLSASLCF